MKSKKILAGFLSTAILSVSAVSAFAANIKDVKTINDVRQIKEIMLINEELNVEEQSYFNSFTGTVQKITDFNGIKGLKFISVKNEEDMPANIIISNNTYFIDNAEIAVGSVITGFFKANAPMIMIYPPQYSADVVAVEKEGQNVKVDIFDKYLISADKSLKLNISEDTEIISKDGKAFEGELADRKLVAIYGASTKSIPAQTNPIKIVVLPEKEEIAPPMDDVYAMDIIVNNEKIEAPAAYTNEQGTVMVPLRAIAETLGFDVHWNSELKSIQIGKGVSLTIGEDNYIYMKTAPIQLGTAPELTEGRTFVPLNFFKDVVRMNNACVFESQIVIDNGGTMK